MKKKNSLNINKLGWSLWHRYLVIAQQFWFPNKKDSALTFVILIILFMLFTASLIGFIVYGLVNLVYWVSPEFMNSNAPGFYEWTIDAWSKFKYPFFVSTGVFASVMFFFRSKVKGKGKAWVLLGILLFLSMTISGFNVIISYVGRFFMTALSSKDEPTFWRFLYVYGCVFVVAIPLSSIFPWIQKYLGVIWREFMTENLLEKYFKNRAYYELTANSAIDNPDQRISQDIQTYTANSLSFLLIILNSVIDIIAFTGILYSISKLLSGVLFIYATVGTVITIIIGKKLVGLNYKQLQKEANFRYGLIHVRDYAESIAFYKGEKREDKQLKNRFSDLFKNYKRLISWQRNLDYFTVSYRYLIIILPSAIVAPLYFAGKIEFGQISQASYAFSIILGAFSIIVNQFDGIANFAAGINRIDMFDKTVTNASGYKVESENEVKGIKRVDAKNIGTKKLTLYTPNLAQKLFEKLNIKLKKGESLLVTGPSGVGKSSLMRALAGLWNSGEGEVSFPSDNVFFIPQKPYMILGSLREQLLYPSEKQNVSDAELEEMLNEVNLPDLANKMRETHPDLNSPFDAVEEWDDVLSQGEQQRLAFARLFLNEPDYVILDESTSALDVANETALYKKLKKIGITYVSVGHRPSIRKFHSKVLELKTDKSWEIKDL